MGLADWALVITALGGGSFVTHLMTVQSARRKAHAEAKAAEVSMAAQFEALVASTLGRLEKALETVDTLRDRLAAAEDVGAAARRKLVEMQPALEECTRDRAELWDRVNSLQVEVGDLKEQRRNGWTRAGAVAFLAVVILRFLVLPL